MPGVWACSLPPALPLDSGCGAPCWAGLLARVGRDEAGRSLLGGVERWATPRLADSGPGAAAPASCCSAAEPARASRAPRRSLGTGACCDIPCPPCAAYSARSRRHTAPNDQLYVLKGAVWQLYAAGCPVKNGPLSACTCVTREVVRCRPVGSTLCSSQPAFYTSTVAACPVTMISPKPRHTAWPRIDAINHKCTITYDAMAIKSCSSPALLRRWVERGISAGRAKPVSGASLLKMRAMTQGGGACISCLGGAHTDGGRAWASISPPPPPPPAAGARAAGCSSHASPRPPLPPSFTPPRRTRSSSSNRSPAGRRLAAPGRGGRRARPVERSGCGGAGGGWRRLRAVCGRLWK